MKPQIANKKFIPGSSRTPRSRHTLALQMARAMEKQQQLEIGERIKQLRGVRTQQPIAAYVGVTLRAYQAWEAGDSGISWPHLEKLGEYFHVSTNFLLYGSEAPAQEMGTQLDRIENRLKQVYEMLNERLPAEPVSPEQVLAEGGARLLETASSQATKAHDQSPNPPAKRPRRTA